VGGILTQWEFVREGFGRHLFEEIAMPEGLLQGKTGVILGVANERSIAWACATACAGAGARLIFNYLGEPLEKRVKRLLSEHLPDAPAYPCDVSKDEDITDFFRNVRNHTERLDFVVHSLAYADREDLQRDFVGTSRASFALAMDISAYSLVAVAREAAPLMTAGGSIVTMTYFGSEKVVPNYNVMGVAKAALEASARYLASDLGPQGIRVNCVSAGPVRTLSASAIAGARAIGRYVEKVSPLRRNVDVAEVGHAALYLVSDWSSAITGEVLHVDGGCNIIGMGLAEKE